VVLDAAVGEQVLRALTPAAIELSLTAAGDIERERARLDQHWRDELERAGYEGRLAERSYRAVDPDHRLVARTTPDNARQLVYGLGLSPRIRPAVSLAADEWWIRDLADELGVGYSRIKEWVERGYVHARRVGSRRHLIIWADAEERDRLRRLRDAFGPGRTFRYPAELTRPKARPEPERGRRAKPSRDEMTARSGQ
jgi:hypothetical protein